MKTILPILLFSAFLFSCRNTTAPTASATKSDTVNIPVINKLIIDTLEATKFDSISENDILFDNKPILTTPKKNMDWLLKQADSIKRDSDDEHDCILKIYYIKNSSFSYCNDNLSAFTLNDTLSVTIQGKKIYPGDSQSLLKSLFPKSFASQEPPEDDVTFILVPIKATSKTFYFKINRQGQIINISEEEGD